TAGVRSRAEPVAPGRDERGAAVARAPPRVEPAKAGDRAFDRPVFAADIAAITDRFEATEHHVIVDFARAGLAAPGGGGDLHVADDRLQLGEARRDVAVQDLAMVDVI